MKQGIFKKRKHDGVAHLMILPAYSLYFLFVFIPLVMTFLMSLTNYDLLTRANFIGLKNYYQLFSDPFFIAAIKNTIIYSIFTIIPQIAIGLILAVILNQQMRGTNIFKLAFYLPYIVSMVSVSMIWLWMYDASHGVINQILLLLGLQPQRWLFDTRLALGSIIVMSVWKLIGYNMIIYLAALQQIPPSLYESATIDGANAFTKFFKITYPLLHPTTFFLLVIATIGSFSVFDQINVMTGGGPLNATTTIVHQLYVRGFVDYRMGYASSMGMILILITLILTVLLFRYGKEGKDLELT